MSALPFLHDRQFSPRLSLVCLVCLLLLPACPAPGSGLDGTAHNHHAQIRAGDAYSNVYGVMAYGTVPGPATALSSMTAVRPCRLSAAGVTAASPTPPTTA